VGLKANGARWLDRRGALTLTPASCTHDPEPKALSLGGETSSRQRVAVFSLFAVPLTEIRWRVSAPTQQYTRAFEGLGDDGGRCGDSRRAATSSHTGRCCTSLVCL